MIKKVYKYTGNMPSRNPFIWYYDETQRTAFASSETAKYWSKYPEIGDVITFWKSDDCYVTHRVLINEEEVYKN